MNSSHMALTRPGWSTGNDRLPRHRLSPSPTSVALGTGAISINEHQVDDPDEHSEDECGSLRRAERVRLQRLTLNAPLRHRICGMPPRKSSTATPNEVVELREELVDLRQQVQLLSTIIDELREELSWLTRNGIPPHADAIPSPVLKRMAADPLADDWNERLVIARGEPADVTPRASPHSPPPPAPPAADSGKPPADKHFATPGDQPQLF